MFCLNDERHIFNSSYIKLLVNKQNISILKPLQNITHWTYNIMTFILIPYVDCPKFRFGPTCELSDCNQQRSSDCNKTTGQCYCLQGYSGETCDCENGVHYCNSTFAFCGEPTATCYCREQYNRQNLTCQGTANWIM